MKPMKLELNIPVTIFKENKQFVAYTPVLDLSTSGNNYQEVKKRFSEAVRIFFAEIIKAGTLDEMLSNLGWRRINKQWTPPVMVAHEPEKVIITV